MDQTLKRVRIPLDEKNLDSSEIKRKKIEHKTIEYDDDNNTEKEMEYVRNKDSIENIDNIVIHDVKPIHNYHTLRPMVSNIDKNEDLEFFLWNSEYVINKQNQVEIYLWGDNLIGNSILLRVKNFLPYFYIKLPENWEDHHFKMFQMALDDQLTKKLKKKNKKMPSSYLVNGMEIVSGDDLYGYNGEAPEKFLRIELLYPEMVRECRLLLEFPMGNPFKNNRCDKAPEIDKWWPQDLPLPVKNPFENKELYGAFPKLFSVYEANIDFLMRFQVDRKIRATGWVKIKNNGFNIVNNEDRISSSQIELECNYQSVGYSEMTTKDVPPISLMSYDLECEIPNEGFTQPFYEEKDSSGNVIIDKVTKKPKIIAGSGQRIIQMSFLKVQGDKKVVGIHMIGNSSEIKDADLVYCYKDERSMLLGILRDWRITDPTFVMNYNGDNFDNKFIVGRCKQLGLEDMCVLGKILHHRSDYKTTLFSTSAHKTEKLITNMNGITQLDMLQIMLRDPSMKMRSYTLNSVAEAVIGKKKVDLDYKQINNLQAGSPKDRAKLAYYCTVDSKLPYEIAEAKKTLINLTQMSYVAGVSIEHLNNRGQQMRMLAQMLHFSKDTESNPIPDRKKGKKKYPLFLPVQPSFSIYPEDKFQGATVLEADTGYHDLPVTTLDFSSLCVYNIMILSYLL